MIELDTEQETIELTAYALSISPEEAREIIALERGEIDGDVIAEEENST